MYVQRGYLQNKRTTKKNVARLVSTTCPRLDQWYSRFRCRNQRYHNPNAMPMEPRVARPHRVMPNQETPVVMSLNNQLLRLMTHDSYENRRRDVSVDPSKGEMGERGPSSVSERVPSRGRYGGSWKKVPDASRNAPSRGVRGVMGDTLSMGSRPLNTETSEGDIGASLRDGSGAMGDTSGVPVGSTPL
jgi:hypothetical protein